VTDQNPHTVPLDALHRALGATMTSFGGWSMPVRYASDLAEHHAVRTRTGLFDVSHMGQIELVGRDVTSVLDTVLVSRVDDLEVGQARYTMLCDDDGRVIDDLIIYRLEGRHLLVANASNTDAVIATLADASAGHDLVCNALTGRVLLALQGPAAAERLAQVSVEDRAGGAPDATALRPFRAVETRVAGVPTLVARTGYTGEDGFELACDGEDGAALWDALVGPDGAENDEDGAGRAIPCGLAARDTLRLEAGLPLHGHELGPDLGPIETGFARIVHLETGRSFRGRAALERTATDGPARRVVGLVATGRRSPRAGYSVLDGDRVVGIVTSGAPSPTLGVPIALAAVESGASAPGTRLSIDVRGTAVPAEVVALPFVRRGA
jgi:aminomethyltransferase